jgi:acyl-CoA thioester hydrolase
VSKVAVTSYLGVAHPWFCDAMGHMNTRYYMAMFDDATFHVLGLIGGTHMQRSSDNGWADVRIELDLAGETLAGDLLTIRSWVSKIGRSSITTQHEMIGTLDQRKRARATVTTVHFNLATRKAAAVPDNIRSRAQTYASGSGEDS